jgi:hypothetical protein
MEQLVFDDLVFCEQDNNSGVITGQEGLIGGYNYYFYFPKTVDLKVGDFIFFKKTDLFKNKLYTNYKLSNDNQTIPSSGTIQATIQDNAFGSLSFNQIEIIAPANTIKEIS